MLTPAQILSSSRPTSDRMATLATRNAAKHTRAELERYAAVSSGWVRDMWLAALVLRRVNATCAVWGDRHKVVFDRHLGEGEACDLYVCHCGWERAWADVDAENREHPEYVILDADEEAEALLALEGR